MGGKSTVEGVRLWIAARTPRSMSPTITTHEWRARSRLHAELQYACMLLDGSRMKISISQNGIVVDT